MTKICAVLDATKATDIWSASLDYIEFDKQVWKCS